MTEVTTSNLTDEQQRELTEARDRVAKAQEACQQHLAEHELVQVSYAELVGKVAAWRSELGQRLPQARNDYLRGNASFDDLAEVLRDEATCTAFEVDLARKHDGASVWGRLVQRPQMQAISTNNSVRQAKGIVARLEALEAASDE